MRAEAADLADQGLGRHLEGLEREAALGQRRQRIPFGQTGIHEAQPVMVDTEDLLGALHLVTTHLGEVAQDVRVVLESGVQDVAAFAAGAGDDEDLVSLTDVLGHRGRALARLVVGVGVHAHQAQPFGHVDPPAR